MKKIISTILFLSFGFQITNAQSLTLIKDIHTNGSSNPHRLTTFSNKIYFVANNGNGNKLYASDGTSAGTNLIGPSVGTGNLYPIVSYNNSLFFTYDDGISGAELWKSDGTSSGTTLVKDISAGSGSSQPRNLTGANSLVFFTTNSPNNGIWASDGTNAGTKLLINNTIVEAFNNQESFASFNNEVYFSGNNGDLGLWKSDGSVAGTQLLKNIRVNSYSKGYVEMNNLMYFTASDNTSYAELWKTDGTTTGTTLVKDINLTGESTPTNYLKKGNQFYFLADDGIHGQELWISDGSNSGTKMVKDITTGSQTSNIQSITEYNSEVYFFVYKNAQRDLYKSDGTEAGTVFLKTIPYNSIPYSYVFNGKLYFSARSNNSTYLYQSDGTPSGTQIILPNILAEDYAGYNFITYQSNLYLPAYSGQFGVELHKFIPSDLSTKDSSSEKISVFPNPAHEIFNILTRENVKSVNAFDVSGKKVLVKKISENQYQISEKGFYFLEIELKNGQKSLSKIMMK